MVRPEMFSAGWNSAFRPIGGAPGTKILETRNLHIELRATPLDTEARTRIRSILRPGFLKLLSSLFVTP
jgi:hypothetical protein